MRALIQLKTKLTPPKYWLSLVVVGEIEIRYIKVIFSMPILFNSLVILCKLHIFLVFTLNTMSAKYESVKCLSAMPVTYFPSSNLSLYVITLCMKFCLDFIWKYLMNKLIKMGLFSEISLLAFTFQIETSVQLACSPKETDSF